MRFGDGAHHRKAHAAATRLRTAGRVIAVKALEQLVQVALRHMLYFIGNPQLHLAAMFSQLQQNLGTILGISRGVIKQKLNHLRKRRGITLHAHAGSNIVLERFAALFGKLVKRFSHFLNQLA